MAFYQTGMGLRTTFRRLVVLACLAIAAPGLALGGPGFPLALSEEGERIWLLGWKRGFKIHPAKLPEMRMFFWFYEWNLFGAYNEGDYTRGVASNKIEIRPEEDGDRVVFHSWNPGLNLLAKPVGDGVELLLEIENTSKHDWPELASIIPCLTPGLERSRTENFDTLDTYYLGTDGLRLTIDNKNWRSIHFNHDLREEIFSHGKYGEFPWSFRWPTSFRDAVHGLMLRESKDDEWVVGIAWERFLSVQGHNPYHCLHVSIQVGPLKVGEKRQIRGKVYMLRGNRDELVKRYYADFGRG